MSESYVIKVGKNKVKIYSDRTCASGWLDLSALTLKQREKLKKLEGSAFPLPDDILKKFDL
jgi:hypothetical protein